MSNDQKIVINKENIIIICLMVLVLIIHVRHLGSLGIFSIIDDEFGYWGNAAYLAGLDWSDAVSRIPYYSYGYSLLLVPLFWIFDNPIFMYKAAIVLNGIMLSASFLLCYDIAKKLTNTIDFYVLIGISFLISMYPAYIAYSSIAWCECLLIFICWLLTWCFIDLNKQSSYYKFILIGFLSIYVYIVHQRALGILIASVIVIILMKIFNKIDWKQFLSFVSPIIVLLILHVYVKNDIQSNLWLNNIGNLTNDFSAQAGKLNQFLTIDGSIRAFKIFLGQFFYLGAASYLLCYLGLYKLILTIVDTLKGLYKQTDLLNNNHNLYLSIFLLLALFLSIVISVISKITPVRIDHILYGRYTEMIIGPVILIGLIVLVNREANCKRLLTLILVGFCILTALVQFILKEFALIQYHIVQITGMLIKNNLSSSYNLFFSAFIAILGCRLIYLSYSRNNHGNKRLVTLAVLAAIFFVTGETVATAIVNLNRERFEIVEAVNIIESADDQLPIYFLWDDHNSPVYYMWNTLDVHNRIEIDCYQFMLLDKKINFVNDAELNSIKGDKFVILGEFGNLFDLLVDNNLCKTAAGTYLLLSKTAGIPCDSLSLSNTKVNLPINMFDIQDTKFNFMDFLHGETKRPVLYGPFIDMTKGNYKFIMDLNLVSYSQEELGYIDVCSLESQEIFNRVDITENISKNTQIIVELPFELERDIDYIGLRLHANEGTHFKINNVYIQRQQD